MMCCSDDRHLLSYVLFQGAQLYYVDSEGTRTPGMVFSVGSGSVYAFGVLDSGYSWDISDEDAQGKLKLSLIFRFVVEPLC